MADARFWTQQCYSEQEKEEEKIILLGDKGNSRFWTLYLLDRRLRVYAMRYKSYRNDLAITHLFINSYVNDSIKLLAITQ